jgi:hypothetical protein
MSLIMSAGMALLSADWARACALNDRLARIIAQNRCATCNPGSLRTSNNHVPFAKSVELQFMKNISLRKTLLIITVDR